MRCTAAPAWRKQQHSRGSLRGARTRVILDGFSKFDSLSDIARSAHLTPAETALEADDRPEEHKATGVLQACERVHPNTPCGSDHGSPLQAYKVLRLDGPESSSPRRKKTRLTPSTTPSASAPPRAAASRMARVSARAAAQRTAGSPSGASACVGVIVREATTSEKCD